MSLLARVAEAETPKEALRIVSEWLEGAGAPTAATAVYRETTDVAIRAEEFRVEERAYEKGYEEGREEALEEMCSYDEGYSAGYAAAEAHATNIVKEFKP